MVSRALSLALLAPLVVFGCSGGGDGDTESTGSTGGDANTVTLRFAPLVGDAAFVCGENYEGLGLTSATVQANDFRLYVHDVTIVHGDGSRDPLTLSDNAWQAKGVALLDFEDASGECVGSPETNLEIVGEVLSAEDVKAVEFTLGVPEDDNHLDSASAAAPLNIPGMYWSWTNGYKYIRVDLTGAGGEPFVFHLGASGCTGSTGDGYACTNDNRITLTIDGFDPAADAIGVDLRALLAGADLTTANDMAVDPIEGCMSGPMDPECPALFTALGLDHATGATNPGGQTVFRVVDQP